MHSPNIQILQNQLKNHIDGYDKGLFITIDTQFTENQKVIDDKRLYRFTNELLAKLCERTNRFCYGRQYIRGKKRLNCITAIEIGESRERLHAHCLMLHSGDTSRTVEQMTDSAYTNCKRIFKLLGSNAYEIESFDKKRFWEAYFTKETKKMFYLYNGFMNIDLH